MEIIKSILFWVCERIIEPLFEEDFFEKVVDLGMLLLISSVIGCLLLVGCYMIDTVSLQTEEIVPKPVVEKHYAPARYQPVPVSTGKVTTITLMLIPASFSLCFNFAENITCGSVNKESYDKYQEGDTLAVGYGRGRINGQYVITEIRPQ